MGKDITTHLKQSSPVTMTNTLVVNFNKSCPHPLVRLISLEKSLKNTPKKGSFWLNHLRFSKKAKCLIVIAIIAVLSISSFVFLTKQGARISNVVPPSGNNSTVTPNPTATSHPKATPAPGIAISKGSSGVTQIMDPTKPGIIGSAQTINSTVWLKVAEAAWAYYQPGFGVDSYTGLPYADIGFTGFTDWDLGGYIQACIDAQKLGLIGNNSAWDFSARINKVLTFLEERTLNAYGYPYEFYNSTTGKTILQSHLRKTLMLRILEGCLLPLTIL